MTACNSDSAVRYVRRTTSASPIVAASSIALFGHRFRIVIAYWIILWLMHKQNYSPPYISAGRIVGGEVIFEDMVTELMMAHPRVIY